MRWKTNFARLTWIGALAGVVSACGQTADPASPAPEASKPPEPVKLVMYLDGATLSQDEFTNLIQASVAEKYPYITLELVTNTRGDNGIQEQIASGAFPDLIFATYPRISKHREFQTVEDLSAMINKAKLDLSAFDPAAIETARVYSGSGLYALPFSLNFTATFYNKEIFDKFGVPYPKEGMTWDDALDLARRLSRSADGVQYKGAFVQGIYDVSTQLGLSYVDPVTGKANIAAQEGWKTLFELYKSFNDIPGNKDASTGPTLNNGFLKDQTVAMAISYDARFAALEKLYGTPQDFAWDVTQFPSFKNRPNVTVASSGHFLMLSSLGKHKEEAFKVIELLDSPEVQRKITESGRFTSLRDPKIKELYGSKTKSMQGKNLKAVFNSQFAPPVPPHPNNDLGPAAIAAALAGVTDGGTDINTALRQADEALGKAIADRAASQGK